jgi:hypothetical protein
MRRPSVWARDERETQRGECGGGDLIEGRGFLFLCRDVQELEHLSLGMETDQDPSLVERIDKSNESPQLPNRKRGGSVEDRERKGRKVIPHSCPEDPSEGHGR